MKRRIPAAVATALLTALPLASAVPPVPAFAAQSEACLQNNRIWGWRVVNERLLIVNDINYRPFLVHLTGGCVGLTNAVWAIRIRTGRVLDASGRATA